MANFKRNRNDIYDYFAKNVGKKRALFLLYFSLLQCKLCMRN